MFKGFFLVELYMESQYKCHVYESWVYFYHTWITLLLYLTLSHDSQLNCSGKCRLWTRIHVLRMPMDSALEITKARLLNVFSSSADNTVNCIQIYSLFSPRATEFKSSRNNYLIWSLFGRGRINMATHGCLMCDQMGQFPFQLLYASWICMSYSAYFCHFHWSAGYFECLNWVFSCYKNRKWRL